MVVQEGGFFLGACNRNAEVIVRKRHVSVLAIYVNYRFCR